MLSKLLSILVLQIALPTILGAPTNLKKERTSSTDWKPLEKVTYDSAIHGDYRAFRIAGPVPESLHHESGGFNIVAHQNEMDLLLAKESATKDRLKKSEVIFRKRNLDFAEKSKRSTTYAIYEVDTDINYLTELIAELYLGTPPQLVPFVVDLGIPDTLVPESCPIQGSSRHQKRDNLQCKPEDNPNGFDPTKSTTTAVVYSNPTLMSFVLETTGLAGTTFYKDVLIAVEYLKIDVRMNGLTVYLPTVVVASILLYANIIKQGRVHTRLHIARLGLAPAGANHFPVFPGTQIPLPGIGNTLLQARAGYIAAMAINALPAIVRAASSITDSTTSSNDQDLTGFRKRSVAASYSSQILFGGSDQNKYTGPIILFPVVSTPGISQKLLWQVSFTSVQVDTTTTSSLARIKRSLVNRFTSPLSVGTAQIDVAHTFIYLNAALVQQIYANIPNSRAPTSRYPFYTYYCLTPPTIGFTGVDVHGYTHTLTMNSQDWNCGMSYDNPGWCTGAIQALPTGASHQIFGLQFIRSFYSLFAVDSTGNEGFTIGFATSSRV